MTTATCCCPDWSNPGPPAAGVYYLVAVALARDPFLLFELELRHFWQGAKRLSQTMDPLPQIPP